MVSLGGFGFFAASVGQWVTTTGHSALPYPVRSRCSSFRLSISICSPLVRRSVAISLPAPNLGIRPRLAVHSVIETARARLHSRPNRGRTPSPAVRAVTTQLGPKLTLWNQKLGETARIESTESTRYGRGERI